MILSQIGIRDFHLFSNEKRDASCVYMLHTFFFFFFFLHSITFIYCFVMIPYSDGSIFLNPSSGDPRTAQYRQYFMLLMLTLWPLGVPTAYTFGSRHTHWEMAWGSQDWAILDFFSNSNEMDFRATTKHKYLESVLDGAQDSFLRLILGKIRTNLWTMVG
jgi:hypothetical protein